jgi:Tfp pilus assembly ATPase PilU
MTRLLLAGIGLVAAVGLVPTQAKADDRVKVDVLLATEHVPEGLKAGNRVDLKMVMGKTVTPNGVTAYTTSPVVANVEVASVTPVEKPAAPEAAVRVQLLVPKDLAEKVEKTRDRLVTVFEAKGDGTTERKMKPVILRLDMAKPDKK